jgi:hypothetical protein
MAETLNAIIARAASLIRVRVPSDEAARIHTVSDLHAALFRNLNFDADHVKKQKVGSDELMKDVRAIVAGMLLINRERVSPDSRLVEDLGAIP